MLLMENPEKIKKLLGLDKEGWTSYPSIVVSSVVRRKTPPGIRYGHGVSFLRSERANTSETGTYVQVESEDKNTTDPPNGCQMGRQIPFMIINSTARVRADGPLGSHPASIHVPLQRPFTAAVLYIVPTPAR